MLFQSKAKEDFNINPVTSTEMERMISKCASIYKGNPPWTTPGTVDYVDEHIKTINFAKSVCSETARLATLAIGVKIDGSVRAEWLQRQIDKVYFRLRDWAEYGCAYGTVILKPNGDSVDVFTPDQFIVTAQANGEITGIVFVNQETEGDKHYTRLEYHRLVENGVYAVTNKCYLGNSVNDMGRVVDIDKTPWAGMMEEALIANLEHPLYGVLRMPHANNIDIDSALSLPIFSDAIEEFKDLDIAYSRNAKEIKDSNRIVLADDSLISAPGQRLASAANVKLPDYVKMVFGKGMDDFYREINPSLNTDIRIAGINAILSQIGYKCGFSNGYFVFNESTGIQTATGVEAEQQRTIQFIKDVRDKLQSCLDGLIYAMNAFADLYELSPVGVYKVTYNFGDITYSYEEDKAAWWKYAVQGSVPMWMYYMKFENMSEEEAKSMVAEAQTVPELYGEEE